MIAPDVRQLYTKAMLIAFKTNGQNPFMPGIIDLRSDNAQSSKLISLISRLVLYVSITTRAGRSLKLLTSKPIRIHRFESAVILVYNQILQFKYFRNRVKIFLALLD